MTIFDQRNQIVAYQYNAAGDIDIGTVQDNRELLRELKKLQRDLGVALGQGALDEDAATNAEYHMKKAVQQAAKPEVKKAGILEHLGWVKDLVSGSKILLELGQRIEWAMNKVGKLF